MSFEGTTRQDEDVGGPRYLSSPRMSGLGAGLDEMLGEFGAESSPFLTGLEQRAGPSHGNEVALPLEHLERTLASGARFLVAAEELHDLGAIELDGPAVEQEVGPLHDRDRLTDQLGRCGHISLPRPNAREHA